MPERIVEVLWEDTATGHGWQSGAADLKTAMCRTVGYVVQEDDEVIVTVETSIDIEPDGEPKTEKRWGCATAIPRSAIRKVTELARKR